MAKVAEGIARAAGGFAAGRRRRDELAIEVKAATKSRRSEVRSLLSSLAGSRGRASREQAAEMKKAHESPPRRHPLLAGELENVAPQGEPRIQGQANAANSARKAEVSALLTQFAP